MTPRSLWPALCWTLASCGPRPVGVASARAALLGADSAFARASAARGVTAWLEYFDSAGIMVRPGRAVAGHTGIHQLMAPALADSGFTLTWAPTDAQVSATGDMGWTMGRWEATRLTPTGAVVSRGTYVNVWRKAPDGRWRITVDIGNPDPAGADAKATRRRSAPRTLPAAVET